MSYIQSIVDHARAGYPGILVLTSEWTRIDSETMEALKALDDWKFMRWTVTNGWTTAPNEKGTMLSPGPTLFEAVLKAKEKQIILMHVFPEFFRSPEMRQTIREVLLRCKASHKCIIMTCPSLQLPEDLEKEFSIIDFDYPSREELQNIIIELCTKVNSKKKQVDVPKDDELRKVSEAALGLTVQEAENAFALSIATKKRLDIITVLEEKKQIVKKSGFLEWYDTPEGIESVGGLDNLKAWLEERSKGFTQEARAFGLKPPRGVLLVGVPGGGKSLTAKAIARWWQMPLLRLDMGKLFGSLVGQSENNLREALKLAAAVSPCIVWIDELEKAAAGLNGGTTDGGTTQRVLGTFLTWMQERTAPVFVVACLTSDSLVIGQDGVPRSIADISNNEKILSVDWKNGSLVRSVTDLKVTLLAKEVVTVRTSTTKFTGTPNHPVFVTTENGIEEIPLLNVKKGMSIARPRSIPNIHNEVKLKTIKISEMVKSVSRTRSISFPKSLTCELSQLLGYSIADGSFVFLKGNGFRFGLNDKDKNVIQHYSNLIKRIFNTKVTIHKIDGKNDYYSYTDSIALGNWLKANFPELVANKQERHVPSAIFKSNNEIVAAFIRGFMDGDGSVSRGRPEGVGVRELMMKEIGLLFQRLGIGFTRSEYCPKDKRRQKVVKLTVSPDQISKYLKLVGFFNKKKLYKCRIPSVKHWKPSLEESVPVPWMLYENLRLKAGLSTNKIDPLYKVKHYHNNRVARRTLEKWLDKLSSQKHEIEYKKICTILSLGWDRVISVNIQEKRTQVYDVRVPNYENFIADGIVMHNTANNVLSLPPEMLRKGRWDEIFGIDLPTEEERAEIIKVHLKKVGREKLITPQNIDKINKVVEDYTGAEIEQVIISAMWKAYASKNDDVTIKDIVESTKGTKTISQTMPNEISAIRTWVENNAKSASKKPDELVSKKGREIQISAEVA